MSSQLTRMRGRAHWARPLIAGRSRGQATARPVRFAPAQRGALAIQDGALAGHGALAGGAVRDGQSCAVTALTSV